MKLPQFVPILTTFTARVAGREMAELLQSPVTLARALADTQKVVGHDGVLNLFDPVLLSAACTNKRNEASPSTGIEGLALTPPDDIVQTAPMDMLLESNQALRHLLPDEALIFATFAGPELLYAQLQASFHACGMDEEDGTDYVLDVIGNVVRSSLESNASGIALIEQKMTGDWPDLERCHRTVRKVADFYDAGFLVFNLPVMTGRNAGQNAGQEAAVQASGMPAHGVFDLPLTPNGLGPLFAQAGKSGVLNAPLVTTHGDVRESTTIEELKALSRDACADEEQQ